MLSLEACAGSCLRTRDLTIGDEGVIVGRNISCGISDPYISRRHCRIVADDRKHLLLQTIRPCYICVNEEWQEIEGTHRLSVGDRLSLDEELTVCYVVSDDLLDCGGDDEPLAAPPPLPPPEAAPHSPDGGVLWWLLYRRCMPALGSGSAGDQGWWAAVRSHLCSPLASLLCSRTSRCRALFWSAQVHPSGGAAGGAGPPPAVSFPVTLRRHQNIYAWQCSTSVTPRMRHILLDWMMEVVLKHCYDVDEVLYQAAALVDRYMARSGADIHRNELQLVGVAALLLASKYECTYPISVHTLVYLCDQAYTAADIRCMEMRMLQALDYRISGAAAAACLHVLRGAKQPLPALDRYLLDQAMLDPALAGTATQLAVARQILDKGPALRERLQEYGESGIRHMGLTRKHGNSLEFARDGVTPASLCVNAAA